jgi:hypothetical protein
VWPLVLLILHRRSITSVAVDIPVASYLTDLTRILAFAQLNTLTTICLSLLLSGYLPFSLNNFLEVRNKIRFNVRILHSTLPGVSGVLNTTFRNSL